MSRNYFIGIDVGGTKILGGIVSENGEILAREKSPTPVNGKQSEVIDLIEKVVTTLCSDIDLKPKDISGMGIGVPGLVDAEAGKVLTAPNINLGGLAIVPELEKRLKIRTAIGNDVDMGVLGEKWLGAGMDAENVIGLFMGTGLGGGIVLNGRLVTGSGYAAEIGHMVIELDGKRCNCGNTGCLESIVGRWAIERDIQSAIQNGEKTVLTEIADGNLSKVKSSVLRQALELNDSVVTLIMTRVSEVMGIACMSLRHILDPQMIILGGGVVEACGDFILPIVRKVVDSDKYFPSSKSFKIARSLLGDDAVMLGTVALAYQNLGINPFSIKYYPEVTIIKSGAIIANGKAFKENLFIRADGKTNNLKKSVNKSLKENDIIDKEEIEHLCKKNPALLIIGSSKIFKLSKSGKDFLQKSDIEAQIIPPSDAVELYEKTKVRKALLLVP